MRSRQSLAYIVCKGFSLPLVLTATRHEVKHICMFQLLAADLGLHISLPSWSVSRNVSLGVSPNPCATSSSAGPLGNSLPQLSTGKPNPGIPEGSSAAPQFDLSTLNTWVPTPPQGPVLFPKRKFKAVCEMVVCSSPKGRGPYGLALLRGVDRVAE
jgi:hypothetical protein